jgi:hypothetical protein
MNHDIFCTEKKFPQNIKSDGFRTTFILSKSSEVRIAQNMRDFAHCQKSKIQGGKRGSQQFSVSNSSLFSVVPSFSRIRKGRMLSGPKMAKTSSRVLASVHDLAIFIEVKFHAHLHSSSNKLILAEILILVQKF